MTNPDSSVSPTWEIREGDALERLREMPDESVHCCVTSPPYFGLRDYGVQGQVGLESTLDEYVAALVSVFAEVRRVLRTDGTLWLNLGDSYAAKPRGSDNGWDKSRLSNPARVQKAQSASLRRSRHTSFAAGVKEKDLMGVPWTVAFALRSAGWYLRQEIIWHKLSPMPESVKDRSTRAHEQVFMLAKSSRYYYDAAAVAEDSVSDHPSGNGFARPERESFKNPDGSSRGQNEEWSDVGGKRNRRDVVAVEDDEWAQFQAWKATHAGDKLDVWTLSSQPYPDAHFATFPPKLVEPCILAGCPEGGIVLDPFSGAATTGLVALRLDRSYVGIELNPEYVELARHRILDDAPLFNGPAEVYAAAAVGHSSRSMSSITAAGLR